jgi:orotate phosphoribosyltransferase
MAVVNNINFVNTLQTVTHVATEFHKKKIIQLKETQLSSGKKSPYYIDLRQILAYPQLMNIIVQYGIFKVKDMGVECDRIASVPLGAVPFASNMAYAMDLPSVLIRNQEKSYGNKKLFEGVINVGDKILLVEDVITTGHSVIETITKLKNRGTEVVAVMCLVNREEGGVENINYNFPDIPVHSLFNISAILNSLLVNKHMQDYDVEKIRFFQDCQFKEMLHNIKSRNLDVVEQPLYVKSPEEYFGTRFPMMPYMTGTTSAGIILDFSSYTDWLFIKGEILRVCKDKTVSAVIIDPPALGWNIDYTRELHALKSSMQFHVIVNTNVLVGLDAILPTHNILSDDDTHIADWVIQNVILSSESDMDTVITDIKKMETDNDYNNQRYRLLQFFFKNKQVVQSENMWRKFRDFILSNNNHFIGGLIFNLKEFDGVAVPKKVEIARWIPVFLNCNQCVDFSLKLDGVSTTNDDLIKSFIINHAPHGYIVSEDIINTPMPILDRIKQYSDFMSEIRWGPGVLKKAIATWLTTRPDVESSRQPADNDSTPEGFYKTVNPNHLNATLKSMAEYIDNYNRKTGGDASLYSRVSSYMGLLWTFTTGYFRSGK